MALLLAAVLLLLRKGAAERPEKGSARHRTVWQLAAANLHLPINPLTRPVIPPPNAATGNEDTERG